jgi:cell division septation protein DedD
MRMIEHGSVRNLEQIQEEDDAGRMPRAASLAIVALGGACIVFATLALGGRRPAAAATPVDPLGELVAQRAKQGQPPTPAVKATDLNVQDVTFPSMLSDEKAPTTALAAVRSTASATQPAPTSNLLAPPPPTDRLSVVTVAPLPAQNVLEATAVVTRPRDALTRAASDSGQLQVAAPPAVGAGHDGGYQLQVSSFRSQAEASQFSDQLRARGHKAYVVEAHVVGRGTWYRVRVGPFATQHAATAYRAGFEAKEHVVPFVVPPSVHEGGGHEGGAREAAAR